MRGCHSLSKTEERITDSIKNLLFIIKFHIMKPKYIVTIIHRYKSKEMVWMFLPAPLS